MWIIGSIRNQRYVIILFSTNKRKGVKLLTDICFFSKIVMNQNRKSGGICPHVYMREREGLPKKSEGENKGRSVGSGTSNGSINVNLIGLVVLYTFFIDDLDVEPRHLSGQKSTPVHGDVATRHP